MKRFHDDISDSLRVTVSTNTQMDATKNIPFLLHCCCTAGCYWSFLTF